MDSGFVSRQSWILYNNNIYFKKLTVQSDNNRLYE